MSELGKLRREVRQLQAAVGFLLLILSVLVLTGAQSNTAQDVKATSFVLVDQKGNELAHWNSTGIELASLTIASGDAKTAVLTKDGLQLNRVAIADATGKQVLRLDTENGEPKLAMKDSGGNVRVSLSVKDDEPRFLLSAKSDGNGLFVATLGDFPILTIKDPRSAAQFGGTTKNPQTGEVQPKPSGRLSLLFDGKQYWATPTPTQAHK